MGIGTKLMQDLIAAVATLPNADAEITDALNLGGEALREIHAGKEAARYTLAEMQPGAFESVRAAEVARRLDAVLNPKIVEPVIEDTIRGEQVETKR